MSAIYTNEWVRIEIEPAEIPWLKIFAQAPCKEMTDCDTPTRQYIWQLLDIVEREMRDYFKPDKINIASFANYLPQVHWHIMARYKNDSFFPEPMWGKKQRESTAVFPPLPPFVEQLKTRIAASNRTI